MTSQENSALSQVLCLACEDRSGSTITERCLAAVPEITALGEVHNLPAYIHNDRSFFDPPYDLVCTCGAPAQECEFWQAVSESMGQSLESLKLRVDFPRRQGVPDIIDRVRWRAEEWTRLRDGGGQRGQVFHRLMGYDQLAKTYWKLYEAAAAVSGRPIVVDSSKWPLRFNYLAKHDDGRLNLLLMYRSPWAVVYSRMRHADVPIEHALSRWLNCANQMELFSAQLPAARVFRLFYEEFCESPQGTLGEILQSLGASTDSAFEPAPLTGIHQVGGSPSKFDTTRATIEVDDSYKKHISNDVKRLVEEAAGPFWRNLVATHARQPQYVLDRTSL